MREDASRQLVAELASLANSIDDAVQSLRVSLDLVRREPVEPRPAAAADQTRYVCTLRGCEPTLIGAAAAEKHHTEHRGHRVKKSPHQATPDGRQR